MFVREIAHFTGKEKLLGLLRLLLHLVFEFFVMGSIESSGAEVVTVDVHTAKGLTHAGHVYLDVRTAEEFEKGHPDADKVINIPYMFNTPQGRVKNAEFLNRVSCACNKEDHLLVGCQSGVRSVYATRDLQGDGYKNVRNVGGGYVEWFKNQLPVKASAANHEH